MSHLGLYAVPASVGCTALHVVGPPPRSLPGLPAAVQHRSRSAWAFSETSNDFANLITRKYIFAMHFCNADSPGWRLGTVSGLTNEPPLPPDFLVIIKNVLFLAARAEGRVAKGQ